MNRRIRNWMQSLSLVACILLTLAGCGGGGGSGDGGSVAQPSTIVISGIATKGPISGAKVSAYQLTPSGEKDKQLGKTVISGTGGEYSIEIPIPNGPVLIEVIGGDGASYISESTGKPVLFGSSEKLDAVIPAPSANQTVTVSPFTEAGYQKMLQLLPLSTTAGIESAITAGNKAVASIQGIKDILADPGTDVSYSASLVIIDKIIQTNPGANTASVTGILSSAVLGSTAGDKAAYGNAVTAAAASLPSTPGAAAVSTTVQGVLDIPSTTPPTVTPPTTPQLSSPSSSANSVTLGWSASTSATAGAISYYLYRNGTFITNLSALQYTDSNLSAATAYTYQVKAADTGSNFSALSNSLTVTTLAGAGGPVTIPTTPPTTPQLSTSSSTSDSVTFAWSASTSSVSSSLSYYVYKNGSFINNVTGLQYTDTSLTPVTSYMYQVKAVDSYGNSSPLSASITVATQAAPVIPGPTPVDTTPPSTPTNLVGIDQTTSIKLTWTASTGTVAVTGYDVYRNAVKLATVAAGATPSYTDSAVTLGTSYSYQVKAVNANSIYSAFSLTVSVTPTSNPPLVTPITITTGGSVK
jgi:chitodextrinase